VVVRADLEIGVRLAAGPSEDLARGGRLLEMTAWAFRSSGGHVALISEEITLATYSSSETSLTTVSPAGRSRSRSPPRKTWRSLRSQWKPMPMGTFARTNEPEAGSEGRSVAAAEKR
jgi:hypothetical protein